MKPFALTSLKFEDNVLFVLDQRLIPTKEVWIPTTKPEEMVVCIKQLSVRGAPLIGVAAAASLALFSLTCSQREQLLQVAQLLRDSRPTAVNLMWAIDRMVKSINQNEDVMLSKALCETAEAIIREDIDMCDKMATHGSSLVQQGDGILTHCNTGGLATAGVGTALGVILYSHQQGKNIHVYIDETRPLLQGGRLTAWECMRAQIPCTLLCDNMAASLMRTGKVQRIFVGADRIAVNGDFANKIGTYNLAITAKYHNVPFYVVAPTSTVDLSCPNGSEIPIEQRHEAEVCGFLGYIPSANHDEALTQIRWAPQQINTYNPAFDVTPSELVTAYVLETGVYTRQQVIEGCLNHVVPKST
eukprot:TRINITY_DN7765_c0_g1_i1.p1 TRINITY_DN7765_c0_g1~~TRINITY_DN7765_c0_g1_i1.p1  ORF type:complete len:358 (+),score=64.34 TRINITY_DN7765_c0_g1_i1:60-1133(+)